MPTLVAPTVPYGSLASREQPVLPAGDGLLLRPWAVDDAPAVLAAYQDPGVRRWHARGMDSVAEAEEQLDAWRAGWAAEREVGWAVVDAVGGELLGRAGLKLLNFDDGTAHVAYWTVPAARGRGVAPRAVAAMTAWAFDAAGFQRLELGHAVANTGSCRVAEKTGFVLEGVRRSVWQLDDGRHDAHLHARLRP
ncbi:GNAT family N-acetyltransferase [Streptacidiphilus pinicola]|uniref:GNAT family N-acetyltransferase n=1 Tax=Streptacidiphilus pinicola TaxID=2219663 RepID=A0A2X0J870_9ACTN|nr:GNAT family N-acetyltransferase [Streptacidiphilus pinicola]RAG83688.1 GNAT family N-acetyltransferase [Streptacidiphilus pinicola]